MKWLVVCLLSILVGSWITAQQKQTSDLLANWERRSKLFDSVKVKLIGTSEIREGSPDYTKIKVPKDKLVRPLEVTLLLDCKSKHYRLDVSEDRLTVDANRFAKQVTTSVYNGKHIATAIPRGLNEREKGEPDMIICSGPQSGEIESYLWPVFESLGYVPSARHPIKQDKFPSGYTSDELMPVGTALFNNNQHNIIRIGPADTSPALIDELWVDFAHDCIISKHILFNGKNPWLRNEVNHQKLQKGWIPKDWSTSWVVAGKTAQVTKLKVESWIENPEVQESDFNLPILPGMIVYNATIPEKGSGLDPARPSREIYTVDEKQQKISIETAGFTTLTGEQLPVSRSYIWLYVALAGCVVIILGVTWRYARGRYKTGV